MMSNDELDELVNNNTLGENSISSQESSEPIVYQRPKLRKIKRPKIRTVPPIPEAPEKISPSDEELGNFERNVSQNKEGENLGNSPIEPQGTDLITAVEANNLTTESSNQEDSYVMDGLPPELDYVADDYLDDDYNLDGYVKKSVVSIVGIICVLMGVFIGKALFSSKRVEKHGLEGVVINDDVPAGRPRCGLTDKSQACVFYLMNWYKQELNGRDFYKLAAQLTGREEYMIETDNLRYATIKIKPGHFAQLNIPALK